MHPAEQQHEVARASNAARVSAPRCHTIASSETPASRARSRTNADAWFAITCRSSAMRPAATASNTACAFVPPPDARMTARARRGARSYSSATVAPARVT
jgi:hypothetical protein